MTINGKQTEFKDVIEAADYIKSMSSKPPFPGNHQHSDVTESLTSSCSISSPEEHIDSKKATESSQIFYYRTWHLQIYDGSHVYDVDISLDNGKTWATTKTFRSQDEAESFLWDRLLRSKKAKEWTTD